MLKHLLTVLGATVIAPCVIADPTIGNPNPWAALIDANDVFEGFETFTPHASIAGDYSGNPPLDFPCHDGFVSVNGQSSPMGGLWTSSLCYVGVVDNAVAQTGPNWNPAGTGYDRQGVAGGPDPGAAQGQFLAMPRGTIDPQPIIEGSVFSATLAHTRMEPVGDRPITILMDVYLDDLRTFAWIRPRSQQEGIVTDIFLGGFEPCIFLPCDVPLIADRVIVLGTDPSNPGSGAFFETVGDHRIREREWFQLAIRMTTDSLSMWVRDSTTIGVNGFEQDSIYDAYPGDPARGAFAGEILATDWLQVYPGVDDDPATTLVEGQGTSMSLSFEDPPNSEAALQITDVTGSPAGPALYASGVDTLQLIQGTDPNPNSEPLFQPHDWYVDNYTVFAPSCVGDANADGVVDGADLGMLLGAWGGAAPGLDLNFDGVVDGADLGLLLGAWGACP
jgi:hypothetical protein